MTALLKNFTKSAAAALTAVLLMAFSGSVIAQDNEYYSSSAEKQSLMFNNLTKGINSDNEGLRRSAIYFAGKYQVAELAGALTERLNNETSARNRTLILLTLYKIGGEECYEAIFNYVNNGNDTEARKLARSMVNEYTIQNSEALSVER